MLSNIFGIVALILVINMLNPKPVTLTQAPSASWPARTAIAGSIGAFSATMCIGGGGFSVPVLTFLSFPVHKAVGTARCTISTGDRVTGGTGV